MSRLRAEIVRAALVDVTAKALVAGGAALAATFGLLVWQGGEVPAWTLVPAIGLTAGFGHLRRRAILQNVQEVQEDADLYLYALLRHEVYSRHVAETLDTLQQVVSGDLSVTVPRYIEGGILEPARDLLMEKPADKVRLSVLLPDPEDQERWRMAWAAGHSLPGTARFHEPIKDTLSRHAFESGLPQAWSDVAAEREFRQNPHASAPIRTMVSMPLRSGDSTLGVFNAVSSEPNAFDEAESFYLQSLGAVIAVAVSVYVATASEERAEPDR